MGGMWLRTIRAMRGGRGGDVAADDDWLGVREIAEVLEVPVRTVQRSFADPAIRGRWWVVDGEPVWRTKPLTRRTEYQARRWAVVRLVDQDEPES